MITFNQSTDIWTGALSSLMVVAIVSPVTLGTASAQEPPQPRELFTTSDECQSCHNGLGIEASHDLSIGLSWRSTMMAHAAVDPYWLAGVRREIEDHPDHAAAIENECSKCHKPMQHFANHLNGERGFVFADPTTTPTPGLGATDPLAIDGVGCAVCHQIQAENLGRPESFVGGFQFDTDKGPGQRAVYGPHDVDPGTQRVMSSATRFVPTLADQMGESELCATCHTLFTHAIDDHGEPGKPFPEQVPYLEWQQSQFAAGRETATSCQTCHMATAESPHPISSVLGQPRPQLSQHSFRGGNFVVPQLLASGVGDARVDGRELSQNATRTRDHLGQRSARITLKPAERSTVSTNLTVGVEVENLAGHKLPTAYPSRRVWIEMTVTDQAGKVLFDSGGLGPHGAIHMNDNDEDPTRYEPHYETITDASQVQIYEAIMGDTNGAVTTGLLRATRYLKDNRLPPLGFDKTAVPADVAVHGAANQDATFRGGVDQIEYVIPLAEAQYPLTVTARLWYQPIGSRWARNLAEYAGAEPRAFVRGFEQLSAAETAQLLAEETVPFEGVR